MAVGRKTTSFGGSRGIFTNESLLCAGSFISSMKTGQNMGKSEEKRGKATHTSLQRIETANALLHAEMQITLAGVKKSMREMEIEVRSIGASKAVASAEKKMDLIIVGMSGLEQMLLRNRPWILKLVDWVKRKWNRNK